MCENCGNESPFAGMSFEDFLNAVLNGDITIPVPNDGPRDVSEEREFIYGRMDEIRGNVVKSVPIDDSVTVHFLPGYGDHGGSVIRIVTELQKNYPAPGKVDVYYPANLDDGMVMTKEGATVSQAVTTKWENGKLEFNGPDHVICIETLAFRDKKSSDGWHMPAYDNGLANEGDFVITHEWGHVLDNRGDDNDISDRMRSQGLIDFRGAVVDEMWFSLSRYGTDSEVEGFAECFAEWAITNGKTDNFAAKWYAKEYGWPTLDKGVHYPKRERVTDEFDAYRYYGF